MNISNSKIIRDAERFLKRTKAYLENREADSHENYELHFILKQSSGTSLEDVVAYATFEDGGLTFHLYSDRAAMPFFDWSFSYDDDFFGSLEKGYEIVSMSPDAHYCVWATIEESHDDDIHHLRGMQMYLGYCRRTGVTKDKLQDLASYDGIDVMTLYDGKTQPTISKEKKSGQPRKIGGFFHVI